MVGASGRFGSAVTVLAGGLRCNKSHPLGFDGDAASFLAASPVSTFCIWRRYGDHSWQMGPVELPADHPDPDGSELLLSALDGSPQTYNPGNEEPRSAGTRYKPEVQASGFLGRPSTHSLCFGLGMPLSSLPG